MNESLTIEQRVAAIEKRMATSIVSESFLSRSFAVVGHYLFGMLLIYIAVFALMVVVVGLTTILGS